MTRRALTLRLVPIAATCLGLLTALACAGIGEPGGALQGPVVLTPDGDSPPQATGGTWCEAPVARVDLWPGEYPSPIINLTQDIELPSRTDPCLKVADTTCRVSKGLYHPWAKGDGFVTLQAQISYTASRPVGLGDPEVQVKKGQVVVLNTYLAEGYCLLTVDGKSIEAMCPGMEDDGLIEGKKSDFQATQLLNPGCGSWVLVDEAFMAQPSVKEGQILEYGKVGE